MLTNASILITGGTGSFGHAFVPTTLAKYNPRRLVVYSGDEMKQWEQAMKAKTKRNLFAELNEGLDALAAERGDKLTLRTHVVEYRAAPAVTAAELVRVRESLNLSRPVFARYLRTNVRTLENWEQGRAKPNA